MPSIKSNMPPVKPQPPAGTQTSDRYGNVISTRPLPPPEQHESHTTAPTCDRYGNIIATPAPVELNPAAKPATPAPATNAAVESGNTVDWK